jgi:hypothetical protein
MLSKRLMIAAGAAAMFASVNAGTARAQTPLDSRTEFTFNAPVELPGVTLPPGIYVFRFADATTSKKVMQVQAKNESNKTYGMFLTINAERPKPSDDAELRFLETPAGKPAAVKTWWYPGQTIGREFIYPKEQARRLAMATNTSVLTTKADNVAPADMPNADLAYIAPNGDESAANQDLVNSAASTAPVGTSGTNAQASNASMSSAPVQESTSAANSTRSSARRRLPRTASELPLVALMGLFSIAAGAAIRSGRRSLERA